MRNKLFRRIFDGDSRTSLLKKNIAGSLLIKGWGCIIQFLLVPITLHCLNAYEYGIWLTINSILVWIDSFDIGLGNGLRNNLAIAIANNDKVRAGKLVSTTFIMLICLIIPLLALIFITIENTNCYAFLNVSPSVVPNLKGIIIMSFALVGATFIFKFIGNVYMGLQLIAISNSLVVSGQTLSLLLIYLLSLSKNSSLYNVALIYTISPLLIYLLSYPITFNKYQYLRPRIRLFDKRELSTLFSMGLKFFIAQISGMVIFTSSNLLISHLFSPTEVTPFQIANRYFGLINIIFTIISAPMWSATTNAFSKGDWKWIKDTVSKMLLIAFGFGFILIGMLLFSNFFYRLWVGDSVRIPIILSIVIAIYVFSIIISTCFSNVICGIGKIQVLTLSTFIEAILYIPLAILLGKTIGVIGIVIALIIVTITSALLNSYQYYLLSNNKAFGIWNR